MTAPPPRGGGMSGLYANLLGDTSTPAANSSTTISKAPVVFSNSSGISPSPNEDAGAPSSSSQKKINAAALRFQPIVTKRPAAPQKKSMSFKPIGLGSITRDKADDATATAPPTIAKPVVKTTLEDWVGDDEDVNGFYNKDRPQGPRGGRKKRKKNNKATPPPPTNWDDIYDPLRPNSYEEYKEGDEKIREMEDWRARLYGTRRRRYDDSSESEDDKRRVAGNRFAPPPNYSFAPPPQFSESSKPTPVSALQSSKPPQAPVAVPDDASGEDAFARRMRMSQQGAIGYSGITQAAPPPSQATPPLPPPPPPPPETAPAPQTQPPAVQYQPPAVQYQPPAVQYQPPAVQYQPPAAQEATISRAPVLYQPPPPASPPSEPENPYSPEPEDREPSSRPGQAGFAKRLMEKQGWKSGQGLGRDGTGITKAIQMVAAGKKGQPGRGKIIDKNKRREARQSAERSEVVVMRGIVDGKRSLFEHGELLQKIGDEYKRYGRVVQIVLRWDDEDVEEADGMGKERCRVYVLFADEGSAQMAVNGLQRREIFEGNTTEAAFYPKDKFDAMIFE